MTISTPVMGNGGVVAVLAARVDLREMSEIMMQGNELSASEETHLVNTFNFFVTESRFEPDYALKKTVRTNGVEAGLQKKNGSDFYDDYRGVPVIGVYRWIPDLELCIVTEIDQVEAFASILLLRNILIVIGVVDICLVVLLAIFFTRTITGPLNQLVAGSEEIGRGNLDYRIDIPIQDEIGQLSAAYNRMVKNLKRITASRDELDGEIHKHKQTEASLRGELQIRSSLTELSTALIAHNTDIAEIGHMVLESVKKITGSEYGFVSTIDLVTGDSVGHTRTGLPAGECNVTKKNQSIVAPQGPSGRYPGLWGHALNTREAFYTNSPSDHSASKGIPKGHIPIEHFLTVPVLFKGEVVGQIALVSSHKNYHDDDLQLVQRFSHLFALAIDRQRSGEELSSAKETADAANRAKSTFLANMSHELRTPLNSILGFSQLLEGMVGENPTDIQRPYVDYIRTSGLHLLEIVNDILDLSKIEAGKTDLEKKPFKLVDMLSRVISTLRSVADSKQIVIELKTDKDIGVIEADEVRLKQVFYNLLSNAVKVTERGKKIGIDSYREKNHAVIEVWDQGPGIDDADLERISDPFV